MNRDIYIVIELRDGKVLKVGYELLGKAAELAKELGQSVVAVVLGEKAAFAADSLIHHGADRVIYVEDEILKDYITEAYTKALVTVIENYKPEIMLFGATAFGRDLAPRVAARVHTGLTADCTGLAIDEETKLLRMTRPAFGGNLMATIVCSDYRPQMATIRPGVMKAMEPDEKRTGEVIRCDVAFSTGDRNIEVLETIRSEKKHVDITASRVIVAGGRGVGGAEGFQPLVELADVLNGEVASSRAGTDSGWIDKERQVGQTGKTVRPGLYIACGISGAIQHLAGMEESECVIAINRDASAPMMDLATLGVVGDLSEIVPKLTEEIRRYRETEAES